MASGGTIGSPRLSLDGAGGGCRPARPLMNELIHFNHLSQFLMGLGIEMMFLLINYGVLFLFGFCFFAVGFLVTSLTPSTSLPLGKSAAITGKLEVRLMGCQDLLEDVPGRSRRDSTHSAPNDLKSFVKGSPAASLFSFFRSDWTQIGLDSSGLNSNRLDWSGLGWMIMDLNVLQG